MIGKCVYCRRWHFGSECPQIELARVVAALAAKAIEAQKAMAIAAAAATQPQEP